MGYFPRQLIRIGHLSRKNINSKLEAVILFREYGPSRMEVDCGLLE